MFPSPTAMYHRKSLRYLCPSARINWSNTQTAQQRPKQSCRTELWDVCLNLHWSVPQFVPWGALLLWEVRDGVSLEVTKEKGMPAIICTAFCFLLTLPPFMCSSLLPGAEVFKTKVRNSLLSASNQCAVSVLWLTGDGKNRLRQLLEPENCKTLRKRFLNEEFLLGTVWIYHTEK